MRRFLVARFILSIALLMVAGTGWADPTGYSYKKAITLSGTGSEETNYIVRLNLHYGSAVGDTTDSDIYLNEHSKTDFSDIRFTDSSGNLLTHYRHSYGNYEIVPDNAVLKRHHLIAPDGTIYASAPLGGIFKSTNNGTSWTNIYDNTVYIIDFISSRGDIYASSGVTAGRFANGYLLLRSSAEDTEHTTWDNVLDMSAVNGIVLHTSMAEDPTGNLYAGRYQATQPAVIYKSSDNGVTWTSKYSSASYEHVHGMYVDNNVDPVAIYAGLDYTGSGSTAILKSTDAGETWDVLAGTPKNANFIAMYAGDGFRLFSGEASINGGWTIYRTTDDSTFTPVLRTSQVVSGMKAFGSAIYATGATESVSKYAQVFRSLDNGVTWSTIWIDNYYSMDAVDGGLKYVSNPGTPTGASDSQILIGVIDNTTNGNHFRASRLYDGGSHYQGLFHVKIPTLPAAGGDIYVWYGNSSATTASDNTIFSSLTLPGLLAHWKFNEGADNVVSDSSGNEKHGVLTPGDGSWNEEEGRRAGASWPSITQAGASYHFDNTTLNKVVITGSNTDADFAFVKNFTYVCWIRTTESSTTLRWIMGRGGYSTSQRPVGILFRTDGSGIQFQYVDNTITAKYNVPVGDGFRRIILTDGGWHMLSVTLDNNSPPNITWTIDVQPSSTVALVDTPDISVQSTFGIGMSSNNLEPFLGDIDDVQVYNTALTATQLRQIYESRMFGATEPGRTADAEAYIGHMNRVPNFITDPTFPSFGR